MYNVIHHAKLLLAWCTTFEHGVHSKSQDAKSQEVKKELMMSLNMLCSDWLPE